MAKHDMLVFDLRIGENSPKAMRFTGEVDEEAVRTFLKKHKRDIVQLIGVRQSLRARAHLRRLTPRGR